jgi:hypothetical protein
MSEEDFFALAERAGLGKNADATKWPTLLNSAGAAARTALTRAKKKAATEAKRQAAEAKRAAKEAEKAADDGD